MTERGVHDLGGQPAGPIDRTVQPLTLFERRVDALVMLLSNPRLGVFRIDGMRRAIEGFDKEDYVRLGYYVKWLRAMKQLLVEQGVLTEAEIEARVAALKARR